MDQDQIISVSKVYDFSSYFLYIPPLLSLPPSLPVHACVHSLLIYRRYKSDIHQIQHQQRDEARRQQDIEEKSMFVGNDRVAHLYAVF